MNKLTFALAAGISLAASLVLPAPTAQAHPPGTTTQDPFLWLEPPHDPKAVAWARAQTIAATKRLQALPIYPTVRKEMTTVLKSKKEVPDITLLGDHALRMLRTASQPHGLLQRAQRNADGKPMDWKTVLNVAALRKTSGIPYELQTYSLSSACLPPQFTRCLLRLSPGGGDEVEIREFNLATGDFVSNGFHVPKSRAMVQWIDADHVLVESAANGAPTTSAGWPTQVRLWKRGQTLAEAPVVYTAQPTDAVVELHSFGSGPGRHGVIVRSIDYSTFEVFVVDAAGHVQKAPFPQALKMGSIAATGDHLIAQLSADAKVEGHQYKAETLLAYALQPDADDHHISVVYAPPKGQYITNSRDIAATDEEVLFITTHRLVQQLLAARWDGHAWQVRRVLQAAPGDTLALHPGAGAGNNLIVTTSGFITPTRQDLYRPGKSLELLATDPTLFDASNYVTEIHSATSKDGTRVDYYLLKPRTPSHKGPQPTLMTGYAAFGISLRPNYFGYIVGGRAFKLWLERGGSLVLPAARGGGERGDAWHRAAMRELRQNSYDDFIAVLEKLIGEGYTTPAHLGVFGSSNGGLLAAVMGTERPDLFNAVVSDVPLTDLFRMQYMGMGAAWLDEYGDPANPRYARVLRSYSPYQNVRKNVDYPPFMITSSTEDNRVGPGHARKFAAKLESVGATVYLLEEQEGGHGVSNAFNNPELMSLRMTFLIDRLMGNKALHEQ